MNNKFFALLIDVNLCAIIKIVKLSSSPASIASIAVYTSYSL